jgi:hypothetical protein
MSDDWRSAAVDLLGQILAGTVTRVDHVPDNLLLTYQALLDKKWIDWFQECAGCPVHLVLRPEGTAGYARLRRELATALDDPQELPQVTRGATADADEKEWISVTEALNRLPFIKGRYQGLYKYAKENPDKLRLRRHPGHNRRRDANAADVLRLEMEYDGKVFDALDGPAADGLPSIKADGLEKLAERVRRIKTDKRKK